MAQEREQTLLKKSRDFVGDGGNSSSEVSEDKISKVLDSARTEADQPQLHALIDLALHGPSGDVAKDVEARMQKMQGDMHAIAREGLARQNEQLRELQRTLGEQRDDKRTPEEQEHMAWAEGLAKQTEALMQTPGAQREMQWAAGLVGGARDMLSSAEGREHVAWAEQVARDSREMTGWMQGITGDDSAGPVPSGMSNIWDLSDRKLAIVTTEKAKQQATRQSRALRQNGLEAVWEVPNVTQRSRAVNMLEKLRINNIKVRVIHERKIK